MNADLPPSQSSGSQPARPEDVAALARLPLFSGLGTEILGAFASEATVARHGRGDVIIRQGDMPTALRVVLDGQVGLTGTAGDGGETMVEILKPGEMFIPAAVLTGKPFLMSAVALLPSRILTLPAEKFRRDVLVHPELASIMLTSLSGNFRSLVREVKDLKLKSAPQRLAHYLLGLTTRREGSTIVRLPHSKSVIAQRIGVRPETLSRAFAQLRAQGVSAEGQAVAIADLQSLRAYCHEGEEII